MADTQEAHLCMSDRERYLDDYEAGKAIYCVSHLLCDATQGQAMAHIND